MLSHDSEIVIVGGGVFGLSTALWLACGGYRKITIFDRCAFDKNHYNPSKGCDGASADINKVFRMAYAHRTDYQDLAIVARDFWLSWNKDIAESNLSQLPDGLTPDDKLFYICGSHFLAEGPELPGYYADSLRTMEETAPEFREMQFGNPDDEKRLADIGRKWVEKYHTTDKINGGNTNGFMDIQGGITIVDKTASIIPEAHETVEATAGTVMFIDIPKDRHDLWERFHPDNYPVWSYRRGEGDDYYQGGGFPISKEGRLKFGFRGRKFTNFQDHPTQPDLRISTPKTKYTADRIDTVPLYGLSRMKEVIAQGFPELVEFGFTDSRARESPLSAASQIGDLQLGRGHAFKFLPVLGKHVKNQLERVPDHFTSAWKWRVAEQGKLNNGLSEGEHGPREMSKLEIASIRDFKLKQMR
ncbi:hypothetical protein NW762_011117 [Fusarium torreyae]|uniref:FAD dependent oxidoreductase domain-containing protein n=1 Tax=Fusarium torreyae TaxID=1237075 RepID=A0A9W8VCG1_9HYPO|nr:hypothetical protein NW762_011117 [Fusarium torreyae]